MGRFFNFGQGGCLPVENKGCCCISKTDVSKANITIAIKDALAAAEEARLLIKRLEEYLEGIEGGGSSGTESEDIAIINAAIDALKNRVLNIEVDLEKKMNKSDADARFNNINSIIESLRSQIQGSGGGGEGGSTTPSQVQLLTSWSDYSESDKNTVALSAGLGKTLKDSIDGMGSGSGGETSNVEYAERAGTADRATLADTATNATNATNAINADNADKIDGIHIDTSHTIESYLALKESGNDEYNTLYLCN